MSGYSSLNHRAASVRAITRVGALLAAVCFSCPANAQIIGPQIRVDVDGTTFASNETSCAASEANPNEIVVTWNDWRHSTDFEVINMGVALSMDGGRTWEDFLVRPPVANQSGVEGDPMTAFDPRTGDLWVGAISFAGNGGIYVARKRPGNDFFDESVMATGTGVDKCWMAAGPAPGDPEATRVYIAYNLGVIRSTDMGETWSSAVNLGSGSGFLPRVGPNGELYVVYWDFGSGMWIRSSFNGGVSFHPAVRVATRLDVWGVQETTRFPGRFRVPSFLYLAVDQNDGTLYAVYFDTTNIVDGNWNVDLYFTKSTDQGSHWTTPLVIITDNDPPGDQFFPWIEVDPSGVLHMVYYDSKNTVQDDDDENGMFDAYYATSNDGGDTWSEFLLTPQPFNSILDGLDRGESQFIGDYSGMAVAGGRAIPCYLSTQNGDSDIFVHLITACEGDANGDGVVDPLDSGFVLSRFGCPVGTGDPSCDDADQNGDGLVDPLDSGFVLARFGPCP